MGMVVLMHREGFKSAIMRKRACYIAIDKVEDTSPKEPPFRSPREEMREGSSPVTRTTSSERIASVLGRQLVASLARVDLMNR